MRTALGLAVFNQFSGSTAVTNYAVEVLREIGLEDNKKGILLSSGISFAKLIGIVASMFLVDGVSGRRPLLIGGGLGMSACMVSRMRAKPFLPRRARGPLGETLLDWQRCLYWWLA